MKCEVMICKYGIITVEAENEHDAAEVALASIVKCPENITWYSMGVTECEVKEE